MNFRHGVPVCVDGQTLSLAGVVAVARCNASAVLDESPAIKSAIAKSRHVTENKVDSGTSVYGLSTGFGGSGEVVHRVNEPNLTRMFF